MTGYIFGSYATTIIRKPNGMSSTRILYAVSADEGKRIGY